MDSPLDNAVLKKGLAIGKKPHEYNLKSCDGSFDSTIYQGLSMRRIFTID